MSMGARDFFALAWKAVVAHRLRSALTMLGIMIGIASVILLTSIGEGTRQYILSEFTQFGTNILAINPGKAMTTGQPGALAGVIRRLTIEDAEAIRRVPGVELVVPLSFGMARVEHEGMGRSVYIYGVNSELPGLWKFDIGQGRFLPEGDPRRASPLVVLGPKLKREIFGEANALGKHVRIGGRRFLTVGVMAPKGMLLGFDIDDSAYIPVASAQQLFDSPELQEIDVEFAIGMDSERVSDAIKEILVERHEGEEDFSITTATEWLDVMGRVLGIISVAVGAIGGISLVVGAIGILTMMWISVNERRAEIGLAKAIGANSGQILYLYLLEAMLLSLSGGLLGVLAGLGIARILRWGLPGLPVETPMTYVFAALGISIAVGLISGVLPARRAAALDPLEALRRE
jgi:putative ABC transport system permease protein